MNDQFNIIFEDFGEWLLGLRIQFSLYIPQGHYFIHTCGYEVQIIMDFFGFEWKYTFKDLYHQQ